MISSDTPQDRVNGETALSAISGSMIGSTLSFLLLGDVNFYITAAGAVCGVLLHISNQKMNHQKDPVKSRNEP